MESLTKHMGAVFYVDILGISPLTNNKISLTDEEFKPWLDDDKDKYSSQFLGAEVC